MICGCSATRSDIQSKAASACGVATWEAPASESRKPSMQTKVFGSSTLRDHSKKQAALLGVHRPGVLVGVAPELVDAVGPDGELDDDQDHVGLLFSGRSERVETGAQQAERVALGVGEHVPALRAGLADVGRHGPEPEQPLEFGVLVPVGRVDRKSTRLNSSHANISYAVFCLKKKKRHQYH